MKKLLTCCLLAAALFLLVGCSVIGTEKDVVITPQSVYIDKDSVELKIGESAHLQYTALPEECSELFTWSSLSDDIATVDESGNVIAVAEGETKILISEPTGISATCSVNVLPESYIEKLNNDEYEIYDGIIHAEDYGYTFTSPEDVRIEKAYYNRDNSDIGTSFLLYLRGENSFGGGALSYYGLISIDSLKLLVPSGPNFDTSTISTNYTLATEAQIDPDKINSALDEYWYN